MPHAQPRRNRRMGRQTAGRKTRYAGRLYRPLQRNQRSRGGEDISDTVKKKAIDTKKSRRVPAFSLALYQGHELFSGFGLIEDPGEIRGDGHGVLFLHAAHLHA